MDFPQLPAANGAVRATGTKPPQGDSATDTATLFAGGVTGGKPVDAPRPDISDTGAQPEASPAASNDNGVANPIQSLFNGPPGQVASSLATGDGTTGGKPAMAPGSQIVEILQGATPDGPPATPAAPVAPVAPTAPVVPTGEAVAANQTGGQADIIPSTAIQTGDGDIISQVAVETTAAAQGETATGNNGAETGQAPSQNAVQNPNESTGNSVAELPGNEPQASTVAPAVPNSVNAAAQATQAAAQGAAQTAGVQPAPIPLEQAASRAAAAQPKSGATPNSSGKGNGANAANSNGNGTANGINGATPATNGIPSAGPAQSAPGQAIASQAVMGQLPEGQPAHQSTPPAPLFESLLPSTGASSEMSPTAGLDTNSIVEAARTTAQTATAQAARAMTPQQPTEQVAVQISQAIQSGADKITVQLRPESLGRVSVELEMGKDNKISAIISAERQDTLDLLQRDSKALEKALNDAGLKADSGSLSFSLHGEGDHPDAGEAREQFANRTIDLPAEDNIADQASPYDQSRSIGLDGGINIRV